MQASIAVRVSPHPSVQYKSQVLGQTQIGSSESRAIPVPGPSAIQRRSNSAPSCRLSRLPRLSSLQTRKTERKVWAILRLYKTSSPTPIHRLQPSDTTRTTSASPHPLALHKLKELQR